MFDDLKDTVKVAMTPDGLRFYWTRKGIGFGGITLNENRERLVVDDECMSDDFCLDVIRQALKERNK